MRTAHWMTCLMLGAAPLTCAAQIVQERTDLLKDSYYSVNVGVAKYQFRNPPSATVKDLCSPATIDCRNDPIGWKFTAGYMIWRFFGIEGVAFNMGQTHDKTDLGGGNVLDQKVQIKGFGLSAVGVLPLGPVGLNARAGYSASTVVRKDDQNDVEFGRADKSRGEPLLGAGIGVQVYRGLFVRLDWDRARGRSAAGEKFRADLISGGIGWRF